jgi:hypothetical protein
MKTTLKIIELQTQVVHHYYEERWIEDEHNPNEEGGYYLSVKKTLKYPSVRFSPKLQTEDELEINAIYLLLPREIEFIATDSHTLSATDYTEIEDITQIQGEKDILLTARCISEGPAKNKPNNKQ